MPEDEKPLPEFQTVIEWTGGHEGNVAVEGKATLPISSPPLWDGLDEWYSPQDLFVIAVAGCYVTTFGHFIKRMNQPIEALTVEGRGVLARDPEGGFRFTDIYVTMHIIIPKKKAQGKVERAVDLTEKYCMVTRSVSCPVHVDTRITTKS